MTEAASPRAVEAISLLAQAGLTVAVAESLTGGALCAELVNVPGASAVLRGAVVAYDTALKSSLLGVPAELLAEHGPVHAEVAGLMAEGVRVAAAIGGYPAAIGVATTGVAGPDPQGVAPVGLVFVALADASGSVVREFRFDGDRAEVSSAAVAAALDLLSDRVRECHG